MTVYPINITHFLLSISLNVQNEINNIPHPNYCTKEHIYTLSGSECSSSSSRMVFIVDKKVSFSHTIYVIQFMFQCFKCCMLGFKILIKAITLGNELSKCIIKTCVIKRLCNKDTHLLFPLTKAIFFTFHLLSELLT